MEATIGRIVWVRQSGLAQLFPGIIYEVASPEVIGVNVFGPKGVVVMGSVTRSEGLTADEGWDWMPYQKAQGAEQAERAKADKQKK